MRIRKSLSSLASSADCCSISPIRPIVFSSPRATSLRIACAVAGVGEHVDDEQAARIDVADDAAHEQEVAGRKAGPARGDAGRHVVLADQPPGLVADPGVAAGRAQPDLVALEVRAAPPAGAGSDCRRSCPRRAAPGGRSSSCTVKRICAIGRPVRVGRAGRVVGVHRARCACARLGGERAPAAPASGASRRAHRPRPGHSGCSAGGGTSAWAPASPRRRR